MSEALQSSVFSRCAGAAIVTPCDLAGRERPPTYAGFRRGIGTSCRWFRTTERPSLPVGSNSDNFSLAGPLHVDSGLIPPDAAATNLAPSSLNHPSKSTHRRTLPRAKSGTSARRPAEYARRLQLVATSRRRVEDPAWLVAVKADRRHQRVARVCAAHKACGPAAD